MLGLPAAVAQCGLLLGVILQLMFALFAVIGLQMLCDAADHVGRPTDFHSLAERSIGGFGSVVDLTIMISRFGSGTVFLMIFGDTCSTVTHTFLGGADEAIGNELRRHYFTPMLLDRRFWIGVAAAAIAPITYMRNIDALRHTSIAALMCLLYIAVLSVAFYVLPSMFGPGAGLPADVPFALSPPSCWTWLKAVPVMVMAFHCHLISVPTINELHQPTVARKRLTFLVAEGFTLAVYLALSTSAYCTFGADVPVDMLLAYPTQSAAMLAVRLALCVVVLCSYPLQSYPFRIACLSIVGPLQSCDERSGLDDGRLWAIFAVTTVFLLVTTATALLFDRLGVVFTVIGATGDCALTYMLPGLFYIRIVPEGKLRVLAQLQFALGVCIFCAAMVMIYLGVTL